MFFLNERQFSNYYAAAERSPKITNEELMRKLEKRLDNTIYRSGLVASRRAARQTINHGLWSVNGKKISIPSYQVKIGDKFELEQKQHSQPEFAEAQKRKPQFPSWMKVDQKSLSGEILSEPEAKDFEKNVASHLIVEFYSK